MHAIHDETCLKWRLEKMYVSNYLYCIYYQCSCKPDVDSNLIITFRILLGYTTGISNVYQVVPTEKRSSLTLHDSDVFLSKV